MSQPETGAYDGVPSPGTNHVGVNLAELNYAVAGGVDKFRALASELGVAAGLQTITRIDLYDVHDVNGQRVHVVFWRGPGEDPDRDRYTVSALIDFEMAGKLWSDLGHLLNRLESDAAASDQ